MGNISNPPVSPRMQAKSLRRRAFLLVVPALAWNLLPRPAAAQLTPAEDAIVRSTYAKLSFATSSGIVADALIGHFIPEATAPAALEQGVVTFQITRLVGGNTADILNTSYYQLVTPPTGDVLNGGVSESNAGDFIDGAWVGTRQNGVKLTWEAENETDPAEAWSWTVSRVLAGAGVQAPRYAAFSVIATMGGRSRSYNAMFLFRPTGVQVADNIINIHGGAVQYFVTHSSYPHALMETSLRNSPLVKTWLLNNKVPPQSGSVAGSDTCDLASVRCGVTETDIASSAAKVAKLPFKPLVNRSAINPMDEGPYPPPDCAASSYLWSNLTTPTQTNTAEHGVGNHSFTVTEGVGCEYSDPPNVFGQVYCVAHASATMQVSMGETGWLLTWPWKHVTGYATQSADARGLGTVTTGNALAQGLVRSCLLGMCDAIISVPPVASFPPNSIWTPSAVSSQMCPAVLAPAYWVPPLPPPAPLFPPDPPNPPCYVYPDGSFCGDAVPRTPTATPVPTRTPISSAAPILR